MTKKSLSTIISPVVFIAVWYAAAFGVGAPLILPFPHKVLAKFLFMCKTQIFWQSFCLTFFRVLFAFLISFALGFFIGLFSADFPCFKEFLRFPLCVIRVTPVVALILVAFFWFKSDFVPVFAAVLMSLPVMIFSCEKGFEKNAENQEKLFKASCYGFTGFKAFRYLRLPSALPSIKAGLESVFGLCWKVVAAGEVLSLPRRSIGSLMQKSQVHLETDEVLALTFALVLFSWIFQFCLKIALSKISSKNRRKAL